MYVEVNFQLLFNYFQYHKAFIRKNVFHISGKNILKELKFSVPYPRINTKMAAATFVYLRTKTKQ